MLKFKEDLVEYDPKSGIIDCRFKMTKEFYDKIKTPDLVQDVGLAFLAAIDRTINVDLLDTPDTPKVEL